MKDLFGEEISEGPPLDWEEFTGRRVTATTVGIEVDFGTLSCWLPLAEIIVEDLHRATGAVKIFMPAWLAKDRGLMP